MTDLKPCPFCGGGAVVSANMMPYPQVSCDACGATCGQAKATGTEAAEKAWNSRYQRHPRPEEQAMKDLISKLEAAPKGSRELDRAIGKAIGRTETTFQQYEPDGAMPRFTTSLDAARSISNWILLHAGDITADGLSQVILGNPATTPTGEVSGIHPRLEMAWCIAALKAREAER